jgi:hypothetical protein
MNTQKLYLVNLKNWESDYMFYAIADNPNDAYEIVKSRLKDEGYDLSFQKLDFIQLIAECDRFSECRLFMEERSYADIYKKFNLSSGCTTVRPENTTYTTN